MAAGKGDGEKTLRLRLVVDEEQKRLVYGECNRDMVDVLLSFLLTPVGAVVRRTGKDSRLGCMDTLYESIENLCPDHFHFRTPACKQLLLRPRNAWCFHYEGLKLQINDVDEQVLYCCPSTNCFFVNAGLARTSAFPGAMCFCGRKMTKKFSPRRPDLEKPDALFVDSSLSNFILTDDLFVAPQSADFESMLCVAAGVSDLASLQERIVLVGPDQILTLMTRSLHSTTPLTDTFLPTNYVRKAIHLPDELVRRPVPAPAQPLNLQQHKKTSWKSFIPSFMTKGSSKMEITVFLNKARNKILFAIADNKFVDIVLSTLTYPFGSISAAFGGDSSLWCMDKLHQAVKKLSYDGLLVPLKLYCGKTIPLDKYVINPSIPPHHDCPNKLLKIGTPPGKLLRERFKFSKGKPRYCVQNFRPINPKQPFSTTRAGGGYMRWPKTFMITDDLYVKPMSNAVEYSPLLTGLERKKVIVGQKEALELVRASLSFDDPLTRVFLK